VYKMVPGAVSVLHSFGAGSDGKYPSGELVDVNGKLFGTTTAGGTFGHGTVFSITPAGVEKVVYNFGASGALQQQIEQPIEREQRLTHRALRRGRRTRARRRPRSTATDRRGRRRCAGDRISC